MSRTSTLFGLLTLAALLMPGTAAAQETPVSVTADFPGVFVEPGDTASFDLRITSNQPRQLALEVTGLPEGWEATFRGGGSQINRVSAAPEDATLVDLDVDVPTDAAEGSYTFGVRVSGDGASATLDLEVNVQAGAGGEVTLEPEFPGLQGPSDATFTFNVTVRNDTPQEVQLELAAEGPEGWRVEARPSGESQASTVTVDSGSSQRVSVEANPPVNVESGDYEVVFRVQGDDVEEELPLTVRIVGDFDIELTTPDQRLNVTVTAGESSQLPLLVVNRGTAPLAGVELSATPPREWEVTFEPETIPQIAPGESATVTATVTPSNNAIAGDYRITFRSSVEQVQDSVEIRATVNPSAIWGLVGVGVIALTLGALAAVFRRYGRR